MRNNVTVSAPGKLMLFGEHAVVYGKPCIVTAVNQRIFVTVEEINEKQLSIDADGVNIKGYKKNIASIGKGDIPKQVEFIENACANFFKKYKKKTGLKITTTTEFSHKFGFGSSSAVTVAVVKALAELYKVSVSQKDIFTLAYKTIQEIQKIGSGVDVAAAVYGGTLYFISGGKKIEQIELDSLPLIIGYSGIKADTVTLLTQVKAMAKKYPDIVDNIYKGIKEVVDLAKIALVKKDYEQVGKLMNINQGYLESLGVSTEKLSTMIYAARNAGAYGAKLSGAGGGDCMLAISKKGKERVVEEAIQKSRGEILKVKTHAQGVRKE